MGGGVNERARTEIYTLTVHDAVPSCDRSGVRLGGRVAEQLVFGEVSSGDEEDLKQATRLARHMVTHWGMSEKIGPVEIGRAHV